MAEIFEQARKAAVLAEHFAPVDEAADAKLEREAREEERIINQTCEELGVKMCEVCCTIPYSSYTLLIGFHP